MRVRARDVRRIATAALCALLALQVVQGPAVADPVGDNLPGPFAASPTPAPPPGAFFPSTPVYATPTPQPDEFPIVKHVAAPTPAGGSPQPSASPAEETPAPGMVRVTADRVYGNAGPTGDMTATGHVVLRYGASTIYADQAVYNGATKIVHATGHVRYYGRNSDEAVADALDYDTVAAQVTMIRVVGKTASLAVQGQPIQGFLYYKGDRVIVDADGHTIIQHGWITTCDPKKPAYHITGREIEVRPGDRVIARGSLLFLGGIIAAALGLLVLPLSQQAGDQRPSNYAPRVGYNSSYGYFIRNYLNFYKDPYWYGTYHLDLFQKVGVGFGADLFFRRHDGLGSGSFSFYDLKSSAKQAATTGAKNNLQGSVNLQRMLTPHLNAGLAFAYSGTQGVQTNIPPTTTATLTVAHSGARSQTSFSGSLGNTGPSTQTSGLFSHTIAFSPAFGESVQLSLYNTFTSSLVSGTGGQSFLLTNSSRAVNFQSDTRVSTRVFDADLIEQTSHGSQTSATSFDPVTGAPIYTSTPVTALQRVPEVIVRGRPLQLTGLRLPLQVTLTAGHYDDQIDNANTTRYELNTQLGSAFYRIGQNQELTGTVTMRQDAYGTGDLRGTISEQLGLRSYIGRHADNQLAYNEQSVRGYTPLRTFDLTSGADQMTETFNLYNGSVYRFTASTNYDFRSKFLSPISYQLNAQPVPYSSLSLGTSYDPHGSGYSPLSIALATPLGKVDYLQFQGTYDWKLHGLQGQNYYLTHTVGDCYQVRVAYLQPLREVDFSFRLLAFPGQTANFGINNRGPIINQSFAQ